MKLQKVKTVKIVPTTPFDFDSTFHKPDLLFLSTLSTARRLLHLGRPLVATQEYGYPLAGEVKPDLIW